MVADAECTTVFHSAELTPFLPYGCYLHDLILFVTAPWGKRPKNGAHSYRGTYSVGYTFIYHASIGDESLERND